MTQDPHRQHSARGESADVGDRAGKSDCPAVVVGIGAPAGGLKSLTRLFAKMPPGHRAAFVLIQHLEPSHENLTVELLKDQTELAVVEATEGMPVLPDRIHLVPPDKFLNITGCRLTLQEPFYCNGLRMPIDHFFCSLAADQRRCGCGIVLSGTGSDGTLGLSEIKAAGGRTLVEDPGHAKFPHMPQSAIKAGVVDLILPPEGMAEAILKWAQQVIAETRREPTESPEFDADLRAVLDLLHEKFAYDFRGYKPNTLVRRIRRRMTLAKVRTFADYARFLHEHPDEVGLLQKDLLIGVTEFFRQPQAWGVLEEKVIAPIVANARPGSEIRVWVAGCSTGQEAYSLAMLLGEQVEKSGKKVGVQIFATDSDAAALATARSGGYVREEIGESLSPQRLKRFFTRKDGRYQVSKEIREQVVFAPQNLTADPPFSRLDLISCRNLLIYLDPQVQKKIIALFHFALCEGGFLFLGTAETVGDREDLFEPVSKKWRIYRRIGIGRRVGIEIPVHIPGETRLASGTIPLAASTPRMSLTSVAQQTLLERFVPACVIIDRKLRVLYVHGPVEEYLTFPAGELTTRVVDMAREGLRARLRGAIGKCIEINRSVSVTARVRRGKKSLAVKAAVTPLRFPREADGLLLITFEEYRLPALKSRRKASESDFHQIEDELKVTREELQSTIEQLESSNDQLKASNEEVTAANEELQSANEEMETSKEELQSLNEELNTINARLQEKVDELEGVKNDLINLLASTSIATVFLDKELRVRRFTPASTRLFSLIPSDAGRPLGDILRHFKDESLLEDARRVLADLAPSAKEVQAEDGRWYIRRITPYRTQDDRIEGVVITFVDVCDLKQTEEVLRQRQAELEAAKTEAENEKRRLEAVMEALPVGMTITDARGGHIRSNAAYERVWGAPRPPVDSVADYAAYKAWWADSGKTVAPEEWASAQAAWKGEPVVGQLLEIERFDGSRAYVINSASPVRDSRGNVIGSAVAIHDITALRKTEQALREAHERAAWLARFPGENPNPVVRVSAEGSVLYCNRASAELPGWACELGKPLPDALRPLVGEAIAAERYAEEDVELAGRFYSVAVTPFPAEGYANVYGREVTERKQAEEALRQERDFSTAVLDTAGALVVVLDKEGRIARFNRSCEAITGYSAAEAVGRVFWEFLLTPEELPGVMQSWEALRAGDFPNQHENHWVARDGSRHLIAWSNTTLVGPGGKVEYIIGTGLDVTERKKAERALRESQQDLNHAQAVAHTGSWRLDVRRNELRWSEETHRIFGIPQGTPMTYEAFLAAVHPEDREHVDRNWTAALRGEPYDIEHRILVGDSVKWVRERAELEFDDQGTLLGGFGAAQDITDRKQAEQALWRAKKEWERTFDAVPDLISILDDHHRILRVNRAMAQKMGVKPNECIGKLCYEAVHGGDCPPDSCPHALTLHDGREHVAEVHEERLGGFFLVSTTPLADEQGRRIGSVHVARNITERKRSEDALRQRSLELQQLTATLGERVRERTAELERANEALRHLSSKLMSVQEEERKRIALEIHDTVGSCLAGIKFKVETARQQMGTTPETVAESLNTLLPVIQEGVEECRRIQMDLRPPMLDDLGLLPTLSWFCRSFQTIYTEIQVEQEIAIPEHEIPNPLKIVIYRVTQEAMNNIAKHSQAKLVRLGLRKRKSAMELILQDNGGGFNPERVLSQEGAKRGLGLSSMKERTELSGGSLTIESLEGRGTTIRASWPLPVTA